MLDKLIPNAETGATARIKLNATIDKVNSLSVIRITEQFNPITPIEVSNGRVTLSHEPLFEDHFFCIYNGLILSMGASNDFTYSDLEITFNTPLNDDDNIQVKYSHLS